MLLLIVVGLLFGLGYQQIFFVVLLRGLQQRVHNVNYLLGFIWLQSL